MTDVKKYLGKHVKSKRIENGFNQTQLGQLLDLSRVSIMNIETGRHSPTIEGLYKISCILQCSPAELLPPIKLLKTKTTETVIIKRVVKKNFKPVRI